MQSDYILRTKDNMLYCFYYTSEKEIYIKNYNNGKWGNSFLIINNVRQYYTVNIAYNGDIYIFCQSIEGDIIICKKENQNWEKKVVLKNKGQNTPNVIFNAIINDNGINLIYNVPIINNKGYYLTAQNLSHKGHWSKANQFDKIISFPESIFMTQTLGKNNAIITYQKKLPEVHFGYRQLYNNKLGEFNTIHTTGYQIIDYSFIVVKDEIHFIYIVKSMFSCQIIYRVKTEVGLLSPIILFEGQRLNNCIISIIKEKIYIMWVNNGQLYFCVSSNNGSSFSKPVKYQRKFCAKPKKAIYLSENTMEKKEFVCYEIYVDGFDKSDIQILPELYEDFFNMEKIQIKTNTANTTNIDEINTAKQNFEMLKNRYDITKKQLEEKEKQILNLTMLLKKKNDEILRSEKEWNIRYNELFDEKKNTSKNLGDNNAENK